MYDVISDFSVLESGMVAICFDDPTFVRSESVLFDRENGGVEVLLAGKLHPVGFVPSDLIELFCENKDVILSSIRIDGSNLELRSRLIIVN